jgi:hypothetical protein
MRKSIVIADPVHPLFERYSIDTLHEMTGYQRDYLRDIGTGKKEATRLFRRKVSLRLAQDEDALFAVPAHNGSKDGGRRW